jgi:hypothetical protein
MYRPGIVQRLFLIVAVVSLCGCSKGEVTQDDLKQYFSKHKVGKSPDYAIVKNGDNYLATIHGYLDDQAVCLALIKPMNEDQNLSVITGTYSCVPLNH